MREVEIALTPLHAGQQYVYRNRTRKNALVCGRRWGKSTMLEVMAMDAVLRGQAVGYFTPTFGLLMPSFNKIVHTLKPVTRHLSREYYTIDALTGGSLRCWSMTDPDAGRSGEFDLVLIDEASIIPGLEDRWALAIQPTLFDRKGSAWIAGTPKGLRDEDFFCRICTEATPEGWTAFRAPTSSKPMADLVELESYRQTMSPLAFKQEYGAEFVRWDGESIFDIDLMLPDGKPVPWPQHIEYVYATIDCAVKDGQEHDGTGVCYAGFNRYGAGNRPVTILDWEIDQISGATLVDWLPRIYQNLEHLAEACRARHGSLGVVIEDKQAGSILLQQAQGKGWQARPAPSQLVQAGKDGRALTASPIVFQRGVAITEHAFNKTTSYKGIMRNHLVSQVGGFVIGDKTAYRRSDDLLDAFVYAVLCAADIQDY